MDSPHMVAGKKKRNTGVKRGKGVVKDIAHGAVDVLGSVLGLGKKKKGGASANVVAGAKKAVAKAEKEKKMEVKKMEAKLKKVEKERKKLEMQAKKEIEQAKKKLEKVAEKLAKASRA